MEEPTSGGTVHHSTHGHDQGTELVWEHWMLAPIALFLSIVGLILIAAYLSRCFGRYAHTDEVPGVQVQEEGEAEESTEPGFATSSESCLVGPTEKSTRSSKDIPSTTEPRSATFPSTRPEKHAFTQKRASLSSQDDPPIEVLLSIQSRNDLGGPSEIRQAHLQSVTPMCTSSREGVYDTVKYADKNVANRSKQACKKNKMDERELSDRDSVSLDDKEYENVEKEEKATPFKGHLYVNVQIPVRGQHTKSGSIETRKQKQKKQHTGTARAGMAETCFATTSETDDDDAYEEVQM